MAFHGSWQGSYEWGDGLACNWFGLVRLSPTDNEGYDWTKKLLALNKGQKFAYYIDNTKHTGTLQQDPTLRTCSKGETTYQTIDVLLDSYPTGDTKNGTWYIKGDPSEGCVMMLAPGLPSLLGAANVALSKQAADLHSIRQLPGSLGEMAEVQCGSDCWQQCNALFVAPGYTLQKVELIENRALDMMTSGAALIKERRRATAAVFNPQLPSGAEKMALLNVLKGSFVTESLQLPFMHCNVVWAWHGCSVDNAYKLAATGFANLGTTDPGYIGSGRYVTTDAEYACMYASDYPNLQPKNSQGHWCVLLCLVVIGVTYPVTPTNDDFTRLAPDGTVIKPGDCRFFGQSIEWQYDSNIARVGGPNYLVSSVASGQYNEIVVDQDAQILPVAIAWFT